MWLLEMYLIFPMLHLIHQKEAVTLCITMLGVMAFLVWTDADCRRRRTGRKMSEKMQPVIHFSVSSAVTEKIIRPINILLILLPIYWDLDGQLHLAGTSGNGGTGEARREQKEPERHCK